MNYRVIFRNDAVSFGEIQVIPVAEQYSKLEILKASGFMKLTASSRALSE